MCLHYLELQMLKYFAAFLKKKKTKNTPKFLTDFASAI